MEAEGILPKLPNFIDHNPIELVNLVHKPQVQFIPQVYAWIDCLQVWHVVLVVTHVHLPDDLVLTTRGSHLTQFKHSELKVFKRQWIYSLEVVYFVIKCRSELFDDLGID